MISTTVKEIIDARYSLSVLSDIQFPIKQSYQISKVVKEIERELDILVKIKNNIRQNQNLEEELAEMLLIPINLYVDKIDLSKIENVQLTARDITFLLPFCIFE